ncbi:NAD-dependent DNA ligase LigA, partial [bacterium]|nr:NAD-dependent DNA ligase LigA [candidate division CSSED10-310 bacterium]
RIQHFASKGAMDIDGLGKKLVKKLVSEGIIKDFADIYDVDEMTLASLERMGKKSAQNLVEQISKSKNTTLPKFLYALGIRHVGEQTSKLLAEYFESLDALQNATIEDLQNVESIGGEVAKSIIDFFNKTETKKLIEKLNRRGINIAPIKRSNSEGIFINKRFVLTGTLHAFTRSHAREEIEKRGGKVVASVSRNIDYLIVGNDPGSKLDQAKLLNIPLLSEQEFIEWIK